MNLEEITTWRYQNSVYVEYNMEPKIAEMFDWLIAEVERQQLIISGKTACDERRAAAEECAAIAEKTLEADHPTIFGTKSAKAIKKEFGL